MNKTTNNPFLEIPTPSDDTSRLVAGLLRRAPPAEQAVDLLERCDDTRTVVHAEDTGGVGANAAPASSWYVPPGHGMGVVVLGGQKVPLGQTPEHSLVLRPS
mgnify:CR=1 FL=1